MLLAAVWPEAPGEVIAATAYDATNLPPEEMCRQLQSFQSKEEMTEWVGAMAVSNTPELLACMWFGEE